MVHFLNRKMHLRKSFQCLKRQRHCFLRQLTILARWSRIRQKAGTGQDASATPSERKSAGESVVAAANVSFAARLRSPNKIHENDGPAHGRGRRLSEPCWPTWCGGSNHLLSRLRSYRQARREPRADQRRHAVTAVTITKARPPAS